MCVEVGGVRVVELVTFAVLLLVECLKKSGYVLEGDECWESKGRRLSDREVLVGNDRVDVCVHPMLCRLCGNCV